MVKFWTLTGIAVLALVFGAGPAIAQTKGERDHAGGRADDFKTQGQRGLRTTPERPISKASPKTTARQATQMPRAFLGCAPNLEKKRRRGRRPGPEIQEAAKDEFRTCRDNGELGATRKS